MADALGRLLPGAAHLRGYRRAWLCGDLLAGVTVAASLVPQVMAYAEIAGLPPVAGLWATVAGVLATDILYGVLGYAPGVAGTHDVDDYPAARQVPGLVVYRCDSPLFFANAQDFRRRALAALDQADGAVAWLTLNAEANVEVDLTAIDALDELRNELEARGVVLALARVKQDLRDDLVASGFLGRVGEERVFPTLPTAVAAYVAAYPARHGHPPAGVHIPSPPPVPE